MENPDEIISDEQGTEIGNRLIAALGLKMKEGRINVEGWGTKTPLGLARVVAKIIQEVKEGK